MNDDEEEGAGIFLYFSLVSARHKFIFMHKKKLLSQSLKTGLLLLFIR